MTGRAGVVRTCIGCRQRGETNKLLRVVAVASRPAGEPRGTDIAFRITSDPAGRLPGRGAWLHPDPGCLTTAIRRRAFGRALRVAGEIQLDALREAAKQWQ